MVHKILQLFLLTGTVFGQLLNAQPIQGNINDFETKAPVPYALVTNTKRTIGINTDSLGFFKIDSTLSLQFDSLRVSAIGYKSIVIALVGSKPLTVYLNKIQTGAKDTPTLLNKKFYKRIRIGSSHKIEDGSFGGAVDSGNECTTLITNPSKREGKIKIISFFILDDGIYNT